VATPIMGNDNVYQSFTVLSLIYRTYIHIIRQPYYTYYLAWLNRNGECKSPHSWYSVAYKIQYTHDQKFSNVRSASSQLILMQHK